MSVRCQHFGECGGCKLQDVPYAEQAAGKEEQVRELFGQAEPIVTCDDPWRYRNKMEFSFSQDLAGNRYLGLMMRRGRVVDLQECHLCAEWMMEALVAARSWWVASGLDAYHSRSDRGSLRTLTLREGKRTGDRLAMLTLSGNPDYSVSEEQLAALAVVLPNMTVVIRVQHIKKKTPTRFTEQLLAGPPAMREELSGLQFQVSATAFFQPNPVQAEKLYALALEAAQIGPETTVFDLYCGGATMGMLAAQRARKVVGIELNEEAVNDGRANIVRNELHNIELHAGDVGKVLATLDDKPDVVLLDPPRAGLDARARQQVADLRASKIVYVSCKPETQAEDIRFLTDFGYQLKWVQPVDQFPHTPHIENIVLLEI